MDVLCASHYASIVVLWASRTFFIISLWTWLFLHGLCFFKRRKLNELWCSCGICGYELNLSSSNRNTSSIGSKYGKSIKKGIISFFFIDESRFTQVDEFQCIPFFSRNSWGLFHRRTALLCRKCGNHIGIAYDDKASAYPLVADGSDSSSVSEVSKHRKYDVKIRALQPSSVDQFSTPIHTWCIRSKPLHIYVIKWYRLHIKN